MISSANVILRFLAGVLLVQLLAIYSCTQLAGPGGSETVNTFALLVIDENGNPVPSASVRYVENSNWLIRAANADNVVVAEEKSNSRGIARFLIDSLSGKSINLIIAADSTGYFGEYYTVPGSIEDFQDTIVLKQTGKIGGIISMSERAAARICIQGTDLFTEIDSLTGSYQFTSVPQGAYELVVVKNSNAVAAGQVSIDSQSRLYNSSVDFNVLTFDNFDDGSLYSLTWSYAGCGQWYLVRGGDIDVTFPTPGPDDTVYLPFTQALVDSGSYDGKSLHVQYLTDGGTFYFIAGAQITSRGLTGISSISFRAKGDDTLTLRLHGIEDKDKPQAIYKVALTQTWTEYVVNVDELAIFDPDNQTASWQDVADRVEWISFLPEGNGSEFWLDDIRFEGITLEDVSVR